MNAADKCRSEGWGPGTVVILPGSAFLPWRITAVGERHALIMSDDGHALSESLTSALDSATYVSGPRKGQEPEAPTPVAPDQTLTDDHAGPDETAEQFCARKGWRVGDVLKADGQGGPVVLIERFDRPGVTPGDLNGHYSMRYEPWTRIAMGPASVQADIQEAAASAAAWAAASAAAWAAEVQWQAQRLEEMALALAPGRSR